MARGLLIFGSAFAVFGAVLWQLLLKDLLFIVLGVGRVVQPLEDFPYKCRKITDKRLTGCEDMWLDDQERMLKKVNVSARREGGTEFLALSIDSELPDGSFPIRAINLDNYVSPTGDSSVDILGFDAEVIDKSTVHFYLTNQRPPVDSQGKHIDATETGANATMDVFEHKRGTSSMRHLRTVWDPETLYTLNNVAAVGGGAFVATNDHSKSLGLRRTLDDYIGGGGVTYCSSASACFPVTPPRTFKMPNGLARGADGLIYVPATFGGTISVYSLKTFGEHMQPMFSLRDTINVGMPLDNLALDGNGDLWIPGFPNGAKSFKWYENPVKNKMPATIWKIKKIEKAYQVEKVLEDSEAEILHGITTVRHDVKTGRLFMGERTQQKKNPRLVANRKFVNRLRSKAEQTQWDRRASYEMDVDEWDTINEETQKTELANRLRIPTEDLHSIRRSGSTVQVTFDLRNARLHVHKKPLYQDVGDDGNPGTLYGTHAPNVEIDPYIGPYWPSDHAEESTRAEALSYKPILDAPPAYMDLPWKELLHPQHMITIEEFLVYFPNHVARWPGLAAALRWSNLNRLFYRAVRIINLARGSHQCQRREDQHTEVLPFQMKIERAIREIDPGYKLFDFPHENYSKETINAHLRQRPRGQSEQQNLVCTLQEAAGYITGINEFEAHCPFSQFMKQFQPVFKPVPPPSMPEHAGGLGSLEAYVRYQTAAGDNFIAWPAQAVQPLSEVCQDSDCERLECEKIHKTEKTSKKPDLSKLGNHNKNKADTQVPAQACNQGAACHKRECTFDHPGPWTDTSVQLNPPNFQVHCKQQAKCTDPGCNRSHMSWAWMHENKGPVGNTNGTNGELHRAPWQKACSFETRPDGCKNVKCAFGHRGPKTAEDVQVEFELHPRCNWDRECKNKRCNQAHSSLATPVNGGGRVGNSGGGGRGRGANSGAGPPRGGGGLQAPRGPRGRGRGRGRAN
ncbi:uncharacterized protein N0V89_006050 [Didymosphaeria variabile]|uniref:Uncharacterized protein n=1 Tax=Didymosphaeria variabile TaxID=1932322 RepID=A0A9W8XPC2_9PLEO|nr:uncharacterized protein N0V89_006050 [Didymosphaeria variabile]KAJ4354315.1 hypothetical protein N0V89_006050 [Didymosphaeria variabile]